MRNKTTGITKIRDIPTYQTPPKRPVGLMNKEQSSINNDEERESQIITGIKKAFTHPKTSNKNLENQLKIKNQREKEIKRRREEINQIEGERQKENEMRKNNKQFKENNSETIGNE